MVEEDVEMGDNWEIPDVDVDANRLLWLRPVVEVVSDRPPSKTVYQRILKPFPSVMLLTGQDSDSNLFVEAQLIRSDNDVPLPQCVDGNRVVRVSNGVFATFKKLKILSTSQQQGTLFRLKFTLKRYAGSQASFEDIPNCTIISNPIEVFSHTQYLNEKQDGEGSAAPPPPAVNEVLPTSGSCTGGTRIAILGSNFINCPGLKVRFGDMVVPATFHEAGTLICVTPSRSPGKVPVSVSNDGLNFCETQTYFTFE